MQGQPSDSLFRFRVTGVEDRPHSNFVRPHEEEIEITAESAGDALNELVNHSGMWELLDAHEPFTIEILSIEQIEGQGGRL